YRRAAPLMRQRIPGAEGRAISAPLRTHSRRQQELLLLAHRPRQGAFRTTCSFWLETSAEPPQSAVTMFLFPVTSASLLLITVTVLKFPVTSASLLWITRTMLKFPVTC